MEFFRKCLLPDSSGPVIMHLTGCIEYKDLSIFWVSKNPESVLHNLINFQGSRVVQKNGLLRKSNNTLLGIDGSGNLKMILLSSFSFCVQLMKDEAPISISYIYHIHLVDIFLKKRMVETSI